MRSDIHLVPLNGFVGGEKNLLCNRARLQSCRKPAKMRAAFSPCGSLFAAPDLQSPSCGGKHSLTERSATQ
jgi:hypothetical protein